MADTLRPRLDRIQQLTKQVNAAADDTGRIVQGVESYLSDVLHVGVSASVVLDSVGTVDEGYFAEKSLIYGRYGPKFRIYVRDISVVQGSLDSEDEKLWANCPRDIKLLAFNQLPELLDQIEKSLRHTLEQVRLNTETIEALLPPSKRRRRSHERRNRRSPSRSGRPTIRPRPLPAHRHWPSCWTASPRIPAS